MGKDQSLLGGIHSDVIHSGFISAQEYIVFGKDGTVIVNRRPQTEQCKVCLYEGKNYCNYSASGLIGS